MNINDNLVLNQKKKYYGTEKHGSAALYSHIIVYFMALMKFYEIFIINKTKTKTT